MKSQEILLISSKKISSRRKKCERFQRAFFFLSRDNSFIFIILLFSTSCLFSLLYTILFFIINSVEIALRVSCQVNYTWRVVHKKKTNDKCLKCESSGAFQLPIQLLWSGFSRMLIKQFKYVTIKMMRQLTRFNNREDRKKKFCYFWQIKEKLMVQPSTKHATLSRHPVENQPCNEAQQCIWRFFSLISSNF